MLKENDTNVPKSRNHTSSPSNAPDLICMVNVLNKPS